MGWKPRLAAQEALEPKGTRPWVAVAEDNAEKAVRLFVSVMQNQRYPIKVRMEAATRLVMIAGATFRGEKLDGNGRPAANLPGNRVARLEANALREVLRQLPPGSAVVDPLQVQPGETVVVMHDGNHSRKPGGHILQAAIGQVLEQSKDAPFVNAMDREEAVQAFTAQPLPEKMEEELPKPVEGPAIDMLSSVWKKDG